MSEESLIHDLVDKVVKYLPVRRIPGADANSTSTFRANQERLRAQHESALIQLAEHRLEHVLNGLAEALESVQSTAVGEPEMAIKVADSQLHILELMGSCMQSSWETYQDGYDVSSSVGGSDVAGSSATPLGGGGGGDDDDDDDPYAAIDGISGDNGGEGGSGSAVPEASTEIGEAGDGVVGVPPTAATIETGSGAGERGLRQSVDPPPLNAELAQFVLSQVCVFIPTVHPYLHDELRAAAGYVLFHLSARNFDVVFARINAKIKMLIVRKEEEDPDRSDLLLIEYLHLNSDRLSKVLHALATHLRSFRKTPQVIVSQVLRKAIWNWIDANPIEFVALCQRGRTLHGSPDVLFDAFHQLADNNRRKAAFWPLQTMLLILCPDLFLKVSLNDDKDRSKVTHISTFLKNLENSLKGKNLADVAAICYVDICKASTYVQKTDLSPLRYQVPLIDAELKAKLFNKEKPFTNQSTGQVDQDLMVDCFVSMFRLNPVDVMRNQVDTCLHPSSPPLFKLVLINALYRIVCEGNESLPWNPTIEVTYEHISGRLRTLFQDYLVRYKNGGSAPPSSSKKRGRDAAQGAGATDQAILEQLLQLFTADPMLCLFNGSDDPATVRDQTRLLMVGLCSCLADEKDSLFQLASQCLLEIHKQRFIQLWCPSQVVTGFWEMSACTNISISQLLIDMREINVTTRTRIEGLLGLVYNLLSERVRFLEMTTASGVDVASAGPMYTGSAVQIETALLINLCNGQGQIASLAAKCVGHMCTESEYAHADGQSPEFLTNYRWYKSLAPLGDRFVGREHQQKEIRKLLRRIDTPSPGNVEAWERVWERWRALTSTILRLDKAEENQASKPVQASKPDRKVGRGRVGARLKTMLGGGSKGKSSEASASTDASLAALPTDPREVEDLRAEWLNYAGLLCALGGVMLGVQSVANTNTSFHEFVNELLELINGDTTYVAETLLKLVSLSLSPSVYPVFFSHVYSDMNDFFDESGRVKVEPYNSLFVEQSVTIVRRILDLKQESSGELALTDLEGLLSSFVHYVAALIDDENTARIKIKLCQVIAKTMEKRHVITFQGEHFRNQLVEELIAWTSDFSSEPSTGLLPATVMKVDITVMTAVLGLLHELQLGLPGQDTPEGKSDLFVKYFTFLTKMLSRCRRESRGGNGDAAKLQRLAGLAIGSLTNLLTANIDSGLEFFISKGYSDDLETRAAFIKVLTNILKEKVEFDALADSTQQEKYEKLFFLMMEGDYGFAVALLKAVNTSQVDKVAKLLIRLYAAGGQVLGLISYVVHHEVEYTISESTLFRRNSPATKLLVAYAKFIGTRYLQQVLRDPIVMAMESPVAFEVDPAKVKTLSQVQENTQALMDMASSLLESIFEHKDGCPPDMLYVSAMLAREVERRFPAAKQTAVAGFVFLRFFCPAIVAPDSSKVIPSVTLSSKTRRGLVLATKILQNLANRVQFGQKEEYMSVANSFIEDNMARMRAYLDDFSEIDPAIEAEVLENQATMPPFGELFVDHPQVLSDMEDLHRAVYVNVDKLIKGLREGPAKARTTVEEDANALAMSSSASPARAMASGALTDLQDSLPVSISQRSSGVGDMDAPGSATRGGDLAPDSSRAPQAGPPDSADGGIGGDDDALDASTGGGLAREGSFGDNRANTLEEMESFIAALSNLFARLGPPPEVKADDAPAASRRTTLATNPHCDEFLQTFAAADTTAVEEARLFYAAGQTKAGRPVFYYTARQLAGIDKNIAILHILRTLEQHMEKTFDVVVDMTMFGPEHDVEDSWRIKFLKVLPPQAVANLGNVHILFPNMWVKKMMRRLARHINNAVASRITFHSSIDDLRACMANREVHLLPSTLKLEEAKGVYTSVHNVTNGKEVTIRITPEAVCVFTIKPTSLLNQKVGMVEVIHNERIEEVASFGRREDRKLIIKYHWDGLKNIVIRSPDSEQIIHALQVSTAGWALTKPESSSMRKIRPEDVPGTLLNMALLNSASPDEALRQASYDLLHTLSVSFGFSTGSQLLSADSLYIPVNTAFVIRVSEKLANTEEHLTLEFLREALASFDKENTSRKHLCLQYLVPWLPNLTDYTAVARTEEATERRARAQEIIETLIELTLRERDMYPATQLHVWSTIGKLVPLLDITLGTFVEFAVRAGAGSGAAEVVADTILTLASHNRSLVAGKIMARLRRAIDSTCDAPTQTLTEHDLYGEIIVLLRLVLNLSFHDHLNIEQFLPEVFYVVVMLASTGETFVRRTVHSLAINTIQVLATSALLTHEQKQTLKYHLRHFSEARFQLLFGVSGSSINAMPVSSMEHLAGAILELLICCQSGLGGGDIGHVWESRWASLISAMAFRFNPALQPRAMVTLGVVAGRNLDDRLYGAVLRQLAASLAYAFRIRPAPRGYEDDSDDFELVIAIITCLTQLAVSLKASSRFFKTTFWVAVALLEVGELALFPAALGLMQTTLAVLGGGEELTAGAALSDVLLDARGSAVEHLAGLEGLDRVRFTGEAPGSFSFALSAILLKGLKHPPSKAQTVQVLYTLLDASQQGDIITTASLGYLAALVAAHEDVSAYNKTSSFLFLFQREMLPQPGTGVLLLTLLITMLREADYESDQLFLYELLRLAIGELPGVFSVTYEILIERMSIVIASSQDSTIVGVVQSIMQAMASDAMAEAAAASPVSLTFLSDMGMDGLLTAFEAATTERRRRGGVLAVSAIEAIAGAR